MTAPSSGPAASLRQRLHGHLQRFDDEAWAALASTGLLRRARKALAAQSPELLADGDTQLLFGFDGQQVSIDAGGPALARCSCPAHGICAHILAVALTLQHDSAQAADLPPHGALDAAAAPPPQADSLRAELLALDEPALLRHAGKAGYRWAWDYVQSLAAPHGLQVDGGAHLRLAFSRPPVTLHYLGGGLATMLVEGPTTRAERWRVAAVLALQQAEGRKPAAPVQAAGKPGADTGLAHLLQQVQAFVADTVDVGLAHLSAGLHERCSALATGAQGAGCHRLAQQMRRLADQVDALLLRRGDADAAALFDSLALLLGLASAMQEAAAAGTLPPALRGRARSRYDDSGTLELWNLGALPWRSPTGYVGLTLLFWSPADQAFMTSTEARPLRLGSFDPRTAYHSGWDWPGLGSPARASGRRLLLQGATLSPGGRLSCGGGGAARMLPEGPQHGLDTLPAATSWRALSDAHHQARRSLLADPAHATGWAVLQPAHFGPAHFDATRQCLDWPLVDSDGDTLLASLPYEPLHAFAIARIEALDPAALPPGTQLVVQLQARPGGLVASPLSLLRARLPSGGNPVDALHFDPAASGEQRVPAPDQSGFAPPAPTAAPPQTTLLNEFGDWLLVQAERGVGAVPPGPLAAAIVGWCERLGAQGLTAFGRVASSPASGPHRLLQLRYMLLQTLRLQPLMRETN